MHGLFKKWEEILPLFLMYSTSLIYSLERPIKECWVIKYSNKPEYEDHHNKVFLANAFHFIAGLFV